MHNGMSQITVCIVGGVLPYIKNGQCTNKSSKKMGKIKIKGVMSGFRQNNIVYSGGGIAPTICSRDYKDPVKVIRKWKRK